MNSNLPSISGFDKKAFLHGLLVVAFAYVSLLTMFWLKGPGALVSMEEQLASQTIKIGREQIMAAPTTSDPDNLEPLETVDLDQPRDPAEIALAQAPIDGMFEWTEGGRLPQVRPNDKLTPFKAYKRPFALTAGKPAIAIIVADYGLSDASSQKAIESLPPEVTMLLSPYSLEPERWAGASRQTGHEVWLDVKFENSAYPDSDPGPQAILASASLRYNQEKLNWNLSRAAGYAGIGGQTDYIFDSATAIIQPLIKSIYQRGVAYLELNPKASATIETLAIALEQPYVRADLWINDSSGQKQGSPLKELERIATEQGYAVGVVTPHGDALEQIKTWLSSLPAKGYALAPVSAIAEAQLPAVAPPAPQSHE